MSPFHATFPDSLAIIDLMIQTVLDTIFLPDSAKFNSRVSNRDEILVCGKLEC
jgi:hypothetical protein